VRFGGHETFHLRPSWLTLGIEHLAGPSGRDFADPTTADALGVGRNMAKSIWFWMQGAGLAQRPSRTTDPELTALGRLVRDHDPYLQHDATWWAVHLALATSSQRPAAWAWFFGGFDAPRFDREAAEAAFGRWTETLGRRVPGETTLRRDVACLLASYAADRPAAPVDPEDGLDCPLRRLGLLVHQRDLRRYDARAGVRSVPPQVLCHALALAHGDGGRTGHQDVPFAQALITPGAAARLLRLDAEGLTAALDRAESSLGHGEVHTRMLGGERVVTLRRRPPMGWMEHYYIGLEA
jgi:hypothetical protein